MTWDARPDFGRLFPVCRCGRETCARCQDFQFTPRSAAVLYAAGQLLADQAFDDVEQRGDAPVSDDGEWSVFGAYPRITWAQDGGWRRRAARSFDDLCSDISGGGWPQPSCAAEEMALHLMFELAGDLVFDGLVDFEPSLPRHRDDFQWDVMSDVFFQDEDILDLFDPSLDGVEDPDADLNRLAGIGDYRPAAWFTSFDNVPGRDQGRGFRR
jgi:hypothetical protein